MNSCLFGSRDSFVQSNPYTAPASYYSVNTPYGNGYYQYPTSQYYYSKHQYSQHHTSQRPQFQGLYPYGNSNLSYGLSPLTSYPSYPCTVPSQPPTYPYDHNLSYNWGEPEVIIPSQGLETLLIAILVLVALDMLFVRSRR